jgi:hypothetical protein
MHGCTRFGGIARPISPAACLSAAFNPELRRNDRHLVFFQCSLRLFWPAYPTNQGQRDE